MRDPRARLPAVHQLLAEAERWGLDTLAPRPLVTQTIRDLLDDARRDGVAEPASGWMDALQHRLEDATRPSLVPVINATGVILHTNLGRACLPDAAREAMMRIAGYNTLEYDLDAGERGSRQTHLRPLLTELTGAEDATVVNNAASALMLSLNTLSRHGETLVSRGELVEIGGAFRIPDILERSGCALIEVGTTNRTRLRDYELALSPRSHCALKMHRSNFTVSGFTSEVSIAELCELMGPRDIPVIHDVGSGLMIDLESYGLRGEPFVQHSVSAGATVVFSGDKLLGGPQAGIIVGPTSTIHAIRDNPMARALRPDKLVLAALEATLALYRDERVALREIPTLAMLTAPPEKLRERAEAFARDIPGAGTEPGCSSVGGGSFPDASLETVLIAVATPHPDAALTALRSGSLPIIALAAEGRVLFDPRTIQESEAAAFVEAVRRALPTD